MLKKQKEQGRLDPQAIHAQFPQFLQSQQALIQTLLRGQPGTGFSIPGGGPQGGGSADVGAQLPQLQGPGAGMVSPNLPTSMSVPGIVNPMMAATFNQLKPPMVGQSQAQAQGYPQEQLHGQAQEHVQGQAQSLGQALGQIHGQGSNTSTSGPNPAAMPMANMGQSGSTSVPQWQQQQPQQQPQQQQWQQQPQQQYQQPPTAVSMPAQAPSQHASQHQAQPNQQQQFAQVQSQLQAPSSQPNPLAILAGLFGQGQAQTVASPMQQPRRQQDSSNPASTGQWQQALLQNLISGLFSQQQQQQPEVASSSAMNSMATLGQNQQPNLAAVFGLLQQQQASAGSNSSSHLSSEPQTNQPQPQPLPGLAEALRILAPTLASRQTQPVTYTSQAPMAAASLTAPAGSTGSSATTSSTISSSSNTPTHTEPVAMLMATLLGHVASAHSNLPSGITSFTSSSRPPYSQDDQQPQQQQWQQQSQRQQQSQQQQWQQQQPQQQWQPQQPQSQPPGQVPDFSNLPPELANALLQGIASLASSNQRPPNS